MKMWKCAKCGKEYKSKGSYLANVGLTFGFEGFEPNKKAICIKCVNAGVTGAGLI